MKTAALILTIAFLIQSCQRNQPETKSETASLNDARVSALQKECDRLADSADAGIAVNDLRVNRLIVAARPEHIVTAAHLPASTFKLITAITAIVHGVELEKQFSCAGKIELPAGKITCWKKDGHGIQTLAEAIMNSCNCYFAALGARCRMDDLLRTARLLGYGTKTRFNRAGETSGVLATQTIPDQHLLLALGHSRLCTVTGLQLLQMISTLATRGKSIDQQMLLPWEKLHAVYEGMNASVIKGTAERAFVRDYVASGKTGTLETDVEWKTSGWFTCFVPTDKPEFAIVVFVKNGTGAANAAPLAGRVITLLQTLRAGT